MVLLVLAMGREHEEGPGSATRCVRKATSFADGVPTADARSSERSTENDHRRALAAGVSR
jgi:hypothetical protein